MIRFFKKILDRSDNVTESSKKDPKGAQSAYALIMRHVMAPPLEVDTHVDPNTFRRLLERVEATWVQLGNEDAHWSVITDDKFRKKSLDNHIGDFFETGEGTIARLEAALERVGTSLSEIDLAMDFGCGVGRLSIPLGRKVRHVLGVDISEAHLRTAKANMERFDCNNVELFNVKSLEDMSDFQRFDLVISMIVLQHNPPPVMLKILTDLCSSVKSGGYLYIQAQTYQSGYRYCAKEDLTESSDQMEMHVIPQHLFLETIQDGGLTVLEVMETGAAPNLDCRSQVVLARKR